MNVKYSSAMQSFGEQHPSFRQWHNIMRRRVRVYDNGGSTVDRYTVIIKSLRNKVTTLDIYTMSDEPSSPQGVNMFSHTITGIKDIDVTGEKRVQVQDLPQDVIHAIEERLYA